MEIKYGITGKNRNVLAMTIINMTGAETGYKAVFTCGYKVDWFTMDKFGEFILVSR